MCTTWTRKAREKPRLAATPLRGGLRTTLAVTGAFVASVANEKCVRVYGLVRFHFLGTRLNNVANVSAFLNNSSYVTISTSLSEVR